MRLYSYSTLPCNEICFIQTCWSSPKASSTQLRVPQVYPPPRDSHPPLEAHGLSVVNAKFSSTSLDQPAQDNIISFALQYKRDVNHTWDRLVERVTILQNRLEDWTRPHYSTQMLTNLSFVALCSSILPNHKQPHAAHSLSRREILAFGLIPLFMSSRATPQHLPSDPEGAERILRERCSHYISLIRPVRHDSLLWRGAEPDDDIEIRSPPSDLLMDETYGVEGATYFRDLDRVLRESQTDATVLPSRAHIATGDRHVAMNWGTPVSIWPVGPLRYAYWRDDALIYKDGDTLEKSKRRGGELIFGRDLNDALINGKEVMFEAQAFFELSEKLTALVLTRFQ